MSKQVVVLITGAGKGIGLSFAKLFAARPNYLVVGTVRHPERDSAGLQAAGCKVITLDVGSDESCKTLPQQLAKLGVEKIDLLINNSGILIADDLASDRVVANAQEQFNVNALGPLRVTKTLLPFILQSSRKQVVNMTSRMGSMEDNTSGRYYGYRASKAAMNSIHISLARDLFAQDVSLLLLHPGMIQTEMTGKQGDMGPDEAVTRLVKLIDTKTKQDGFTFFHRDGQQLPF
ncbi:hypothetical protein BASA81_007336 [Batrachochytrium salamandrivorans]|nr:hypothetical protein BASA81_007336 [Batrachochytrium salamandrivorans]